MITVKKTVFSVNLEVPSDQISREDRLVLGKQQINLVLSLYQLFNAKGKQI